MIDINDTNFVLFNGVIANTVQKEDGRFSIICSDACIRGDIFDISNIRKKIIFVENNLIDIIKFVIDDSMYL